MTDPGAPYGRKKDGSPKRMPITHPDHPLYKAPGHMPGAGRKPARGAKADRGGEGIGGPATGPGGRITAENSAELTRLRNDPDEKAGRAARTELMTRRMEDLAFTAESEQTQLAAAIAAANRLGGSPRQAVELTGADGGPIESTYVDRPPNETREEWIARRQKEIASVGAPTRSPD